MGSYILSLSGLALVPGDVFFRYSPELFHKFLPLSVRLALAANLVSQITRSFDVRILQGLRPSPQLARNVLSSQFQI